MPALRLAILAYNGSPRARLCVSALTNLDAVEIAGIVAPEPDAAVRDLLRRAFPGRAFSLAESGLPVLRKLPPADLVVAVDGPAPRGGVEVIRFNRTLAAVRDGQILAEQALRPHENPDPLAAELLTRAILVLRGLSAPPHLPHRRRTGDARWKQVLYAGMHRSGLVPLLGRKHAAIILYHRVNDLTADALTTGVQRFAEHLVALKQNYNVVRTADLIAGKAPPRAVAIHFDDCYRDVWTHAAPLLRAAGLSATTFVSTGFVGTSRRFDHDRDCPVAFDNLRAEDLQAMARDGFEFGAHTVNHVDLGTAPLEVAKREIEDSKTALEQWGLGPVEYFSFPFGRKRNIRPETEALVRRAGFRAMFSAHGGCIRAGRPPFDVPRIGISGAATALEVLMAVEGLSLSAIRQRLLGDRFYR